MTSQPEEKKRWIPFKTKICSIGAVTFLMLTTLHLAFSDAVWQLTACLTILFTIWAVLSYKTRGAI